MKRFLVGFFILFLFLIIPVHANALTTGTYNYYSLDKARTDEVSLTVNQDGTYKAIYRENDSQAERTVKNWDTLKDKAGVFDYIVITDKSWQKAQLWGYFTQEEAFAKQKEAINNKITDVVILSRNTSSNKGKKIGVCTYQTNEIPVDNLSDFTLKVTLYNDGSTETSSTVGTNSYIVENRGSVGNSGIMFDIDKNMFKKNGTYYQEYQTVKNCPTMQFVYWGNSNLFEFKVGDTEEFYDAYYQTVSPKMTEINKESGEEIEEEQKGCEFTSSISVDVLSEKSLTVRFYTKGGNKYYSLKSGSSMLSQEKKVEEATIVQGVMISIDPDSISKFYSNPCANVKMYVRYEYGSIVNVILQATEPEAYEQRPNSSNGESSDYDKENSHVDLSGLNGTVGCDGIFGKTDANGNFEKESFGWILQTILNYIKIIGPILVILFSMMEFIKAIATSDEDAMKKAQSRLVIRLIVVVALFLLPFLVGEVLKLINGISNPTCGFK